MTATTPSTSTNARSLKQRGQKTIVLHGRVQKVDTDSTHSATDEDSHDEPTLDLQQVVRRAQERKSTFAQLTHEVQSFAVMVGKLESTLQESLQSPEAAWRAKIIIKSAQETDKDLWNKLYQYETTLVAGSRSPSSRQELRMAQTACMKLHRDFKRVHKALVMALTVYQQKQQAEVSQLGAVGWSGGNTGVKDEDFYDRAMREREEELRNMNRSMHQVNDIYNELAKLVGDQQSNIDKLEQDTEYAKSNVTSGLNQLLCFAERNSETWDSLTSSMKCNPMECAQDFELIGTSGDDDVKDSTRFNHDEQPESSLNQTVAEWQKVIDSLVDEANKMNQSLVNMGKDLLEDLDISSGIVEDGESRKNVKD